MALKKLKLPLFLLVSILLQSVLIFNLNKKINPSVPSTANDFTTEPTFPTATSTVQPTDKPTVIGKATPKPIAKKDTTQNNDSGTTTSNNTTNNTNSGDSSPSNESATNSPTTAPAVATTIPTAQPTVAPVEAANIQIWSKGWVYTNTGQQYSADGDIKIFNGSTQIASGSYNSYEEPYKVSNLPINSTLTITFYMGTCGQAKTINTGSTSTLYQVDFSFNPTTVCL